MVRGDEAGDPRQLPVDEPLRPVGLDEEGRRAPRGSEATGGRSELIVDPHERCIPANLSEALALLGDRAATKRQGRTRAQVQERADELGCVLLPAGEPDQSGLLDRVTEALGDDPGEEDREAGDAQRAADERWIVPDPREDDAVNIERNERREVGSAVHADNMAPDAGGAGEPLRASEGSASCGRAAGMVGQVSPIFLPLTREPRVRLVPAPVPSPSSAAAIKAARRRLLARPGGFDGPILIAHQADAHGIGAYVTRYSWGMAASSGYADLGLGMLGVKLWLTRGGSALWQLRAEAVADGGTWDFAVAGAVEPGQTPTQAILREAQEEIGVGADQLLGLRPVLLAAGEGLGVVLLYQAELVASVEPEGAPAEIAALHWGAGADAPGPLCHCAAAILPAALSQISP